MSQHSVMAFFEAVRTEETVVERMRAASENADAFARLASDLGRERGFVFEPSEVKAAIDSLAAKSGGELPDKDLADVAGGAYMYFTLRGGGAASSGCATTAILRLSASCNY
jgi:hypothetical protein